MARRAGDPQGLGPTLTAAFALLRSAEACAVALGDLGDIELPPAQAPSESDQGTVRAVATLYLAAELEAAMLIPAVDLLCGLAMSGGLTADLGDATEMIATFWRGRGERFSADERAAFFSRLFGGTVPAAPGRAEAAVNQEFEGLFIDLCEALYKLDENAVSAEYGSPYQQARLRIAVGQLLDNILRHGGGLSAYVARDCLTTTQSALALLNHPRVQQAFGVRQPWDVVREVTARYMRATPQITAHVGRGKAGLTLLAWVADALPALSRSDQPLVGLDHPVIVAAVEWLQTSLGLSEDVNPGEPVVPPRVGATTPGA